MGWRCAVVVVVGGGGGVVGVEDDNDDSFSFISLLLSLLPLSVLLLQ